MQGPIKNSRLGLAHASARLEVRPGRGSIARDGASCQRGDVKETCPSRPRQLIDASNDTAIVGPVHHGGDAKPAVDEIADFSTWLSIFMRFSTRVVSTDFGESTGCRPAQMR